MSTALLLLLLFAKIEKGRGKADKSKMLELYLSKVKRLPTFSLRVNINKAQLRVIEEAKKGNKEAESCFCSCIN